MTERNPLIRWADYFENALKRAFSGDIDKIKTDIRFKNIDEIKTFIGIESIDNEYTKIINKWFFLVDRCSVVKSASKQENKETKRPINTFMFMNSAFERYVECIMIIKRSKKSESVIKAQSYLKEFVELLDAFEEFIYSQIIEDITSLNIERNTIKEQMDI
jgi:signal transduction histidine kinase